MSLLDGLKFLFSPSYIVGLCTFWGGGGDSGGGGQNTVQQVQIPPELVPYVKESIQQAQKVAALPYVAYKGQRIADLTPQQQAIMAQTLNMQDMGQFGQATSGAGATGTVGYNAARAGLQRALGFEPGQFTAETVRSPELMQHQMSPVERARAATFSDQAAAKYMSPYQQNVTDIAAREAQRQAAITQRQADLNAPRQGTYGGARQALLQAERERNLSQNIGDLYARGQQAAYENAQQQFERDQARRAAAQAMNIQSGLTTGQANLQARLGTQQLGAQQNLQAQLANQQARLDAQKAAEQSRQYGAGLGAQVGQAGLGTSMQASQLLGQLGQQQQEARLQRLAAQQQIAQQIQAQNQAVLSQRYQDFLEQRGYPKEQAAFYSAIVRGLPISNTSTSTTTAPAPSMLSQMGGLGLAGLGLYNLLGK